MSYTTADLVSDTKLSGFLPPTAEVSTANYLSWADQEVKTYLVPLILGARGEYYVNDSDTTLTTSVTTIAIPYRAIGGKLRQVTLLDSAGNVQNLPQISLDDLQDSLLGYYLKADSLVLFNVNSSFTGTLRVQYYLRPGSLVDYVAGTTIGVITNINTGTGVISCSGGIPSTISTSTPVDFVKAKPGYTTLGFDITPTNKTGTTITVATTSIPSTLAVGDYICLATQTPVPQIPDDLMPVLVMRMVARALQARGDQVGAESARGEAARMARDALLLVSNRIDGSPMKLVNRASPWRRGAQVFMKVWR